MKKPHTDLTPERIQALLDGDLPAREAEALRAAVEADPRAKAEFEAFRELMAQLDELPVLTPGPAFRDRILDELPARQSTPVVMGLFGRRDAHAHATADELQEHLDGQLAARSAERLEEHLGRCGQCRTEMDALHAVATQVAKLPELAPSPGFGDGVMASIRIQQMAAMAMAPTSRRERLAAWIRSKRPARSQSWAAVLGAGTAPVVTLAIALQAVFSHELVTFGNLFSFLALKASTLAAPLQQAVASLAAENAWLSASVQLLSSIGSSAPLMAGAAVAVLGTCLSAGWILYRNLIVPTGEEGRYARVSH